MGRRKTILYLLIFLFVAATKAHSQEKSIPYADLVKRLTDLKALAVLPAEGEKSAMWSSYDRKSKIDPETGKFVDWSANNDGLSPQYIRKEGKNMVLAEMEGPGAIVRMWSASPKDGHVKIYIDGKETPVLDLPFIDYFKTSSIGSFNYPELVYETAARGFNNYVPITYQRSCKIVAEAGWGQYYHFNYISFPEGTTVESFRASPAQENAKALSTANAFFAGSLGELPYPADKGEVKELASIIAPGDSAKITLHGRKAIFSLRAEVFVTGDDKMEKALRRLVLKINWDGQPAAAVWSPLGDFFGSAPGYNLYETLPMGMTEEGMYSYWYMPFEESATLTLVNHFNEPIDVALTIGLEALAEGKNYGRFHAKWHRNILPLEDPDRWPDWTVLETEGHGRYLGMSLLVWNPKGGSCKKYGGAGHWWWGEGDAKFFVDGETFPSTFGTGTEDYFGYAWCIPDYFTRAFHSQSHTDGNMGYQSLNRWQIIDNVPFQESFHGYIEKYFPDKWPTQYAVTTYWYLDEEGKDPIRPTPADELYGWEIPYTVYRKPDVIEAEGMEILKNTGGYATTDAFIHEQLFDEVSGHKILLWHGKPEAPSNLTASFNLSKPGKYKVTVQVAKSSDGGKFNAYLNGRLAIEGLDMKTSTAPGKAVTVELGTFDLEQGDQVLKFEWVETEGYGNTLMVDYIDLEPV